MASTASGLAGVRAMSASRKRSASGVVILAVCAEACADANQSVPESSANERGAQACSTSDASVVSSQVMTARTRRGTFLP